MRRTILATLALLAWAASASAATITIDNLWPYDGYQMNSFVIEANMQLFSTFDTIDPGKSASLEIPFEEGFTFYAVRVGGICPQNCGWGDGMSNYWAGDWIAPRSVINLLWPATDGGEYVPIVRATYTAAPKPSTSVPEPSSLALFAAGVIGLVVRRWRT